MGFFSSVWSGFKSAASAVGSAVSVGWQAAKEVAGKAVAWMANKAERFVDNVKEAWKAVKPYVTEIRIVLQAAAAAVPIPWMKAAILALDKGVAALTAFENSPIAKKVEAAIQWAIKMAQRLQGSKRQDAGLAGVQEAADELTDEELRLAKQHQETFRFAERESGSVETRHQMELAAALNDFQIARTELARAIEASPTDFEHYLRLRATQKLLDLADRKFRSAQAIDDLSADDLFLVRIASDLVKDSPELSREAAARLDRVLEERHGRKLTPFVFEEMIASWAKRAEVLEKEWTDGNREHARDTMLLKRLTLAMDIQDELAPEEAAQLAQLRTDVPVRKAELDKLAQRQHDLERYVGAAEGFIQLLEKTPQQIEGEDRGYLLNDGPRVGQILIDCAEHDVAFAALDANAQALVTDFANAFAIDSHKRMKEILEVAA